MRSSSAPTSGSSSAPAKSMLPSESVGGVPSSSCSGGVAAAAAPMASPTRPNVAFCAAAGGPRTRVSGGWGGAPLAGGARRKPAHDGALDGVLPLLLQHGHVRDGRRGGEQVDGDDARVRVDGEQRGQRGQREGEQHGDGADRDGRLGDDRDDRPNRRACADTAPDGERSAAAPARARAGLERRGGARSASRSAR